MSIGRVCGGGGGKKYVRVMPRGRACVVEGRSHSSARLPMPADGSAARSTSWPWVACILILFALGIRYKHTTCIPAERIEKLEEELYTALRRAAGSDKTGHLSRVMPRIVLQQVRRKHAHVPKVRLWAEAVLETKIPPIKCPCRRVARMAGGQICRWGR